LSENVFRVECLVVLGSDSCTDRSGNRNLSIDNLSIGNDVAFMIFAPGVRQDVDLYCVRD